MKKAPGRTEFQRGILSHADGQWSVRPAGAQGLDVSADGRRALLTLNGGAVEVWDLEGSAAPD